MCLDCLKEAPGAERESANWIFPIFDYRHPSIKKALWLLKYKGRKRLANVFAEIIYEKILEELSELSIMENFINPILIPIPLSVKRYRERGFNQAELICKELIKINNIRHLPANFGAGGVYLKLENNILIKIKETEHQARIRERNIRLKNLAGSFAIKGNQQNIEKRNIILIDDITTTGATLNEARKILKHAGARKVIAFTAAH
jgi:ComF family protein